MEKLGHYLKATAAELQRVSWPSRQQATVYTALVIGISVVVALFLSGFDYVFQNLLDFII